MPVNPQTSTAERLDESSSPHSIDPWLFTVIEEAIFFGKPADFDEILSGIPYGDAISDELRHGIESLRWFRAHYGYEAKIDPDLKRKAAFIDTEWSHTLLRMLEAEDQHIHLRSF